MPVTKRLVNRHSSVVALLTFAGLLYLGGNGFARSRNSNSQTGLSAVKLTASIQSVRYCAGDNDVYTVHLQLRLHYSNAGDRSLILFKPRAPIEIVSAVIAGSTDALREHRYDAVVQYDQFVQPERPPSVNAPDPTRFIAVHPGHSYELTGTINIPARFKINPPIPGTIAPGTHVMALEVTDWPFSPESGKHLQEKWSAYGFLGYDAINTEPLQLNIPATPKVQDCNR